VTDKSALINTICKALAEKDLDSARTKLADKWKFQPPPNTSKRLTVSKRLEMEVFHRDNFTCCYCGKPTIFLGTLRTISLLMPDDFPYHKNWKWNITHPAYWEMATSCDHLIPVARGGTNDKQNLVTVCYMCNSIKANWTLDELRWSLRETGDSGWDGLAGLFVRMMEQYNIKNRRLRSYYKIIKSLPPFSGNK